MTTTNPDAHVTVGDVLDFEGDPVTVRRDFDTLVISQMAINREGIARLRKILDDGEAAIVAYEEAQRLADEARIAAADASAVPFPGRAGYVTGDCGHAVARSEWRAGLRNCERCGG